MASKKKKDSFREDESSLVEKDSFSSLKSEVVKEPVEVKPSSKPEKRKKALKLLTFEQWAKRRKVKTQHMGGMKVYCKNVNKKRSLESWDEIFKSY